MRSVSFSELCGNEIEDSMRPEIDRESCDVSRLSDNQLKFREDGVLILEKFIPDSLMDQYIKLRSRLPDLDGWTMPCPYLHYDEIKNIALYKPVMDVLQELIGYEMCLHLNLTGWISTERDWHQDMYLNPVAVGDHYAATWIALGDIHPDSGPFQFVRGSNRWPCIKQERVFDIMAEQRISQSDPLWPRKTQDWVAKACQDEIAKRGAIVESYLPERGDLLIWHSRLLHRGSKPKDRNLQRRALISHYSSVHHRPDFPKKTLYRNAGTKSEGYFYDHHMPLMGPQRV
jgi:ectoine hydroxylase-related dioxygenase (phytanoyl-CoA dioxygenase family)